ncbi:hypothetical protein BJ170DRAFT_692145 [Xylariales sp. AK1849]|nr:hypothetical protein BJ170DRAFT_692145 [Xylariales sp. AK1849]
MEPKQLASTFCGSEDPEGGCMLRVLVKDKDVNYWLPPLPTGDWNCARATMNPDARQLQLTGLENNILPGVENAWHETRIDHREFKISRTFTAGHGNVFIVTHPSFDRPILLKIANFPQQVAYMQRETDMYRRIEGRHIGPKFLGHVTEAGRVTGFITEFIADAHYPREDEDFKACLKALDRLHELDICHRDAHRQNFLILQTGQVYIIDFESSELLSEMTDGMAEFEAKKAMDTAHLTHSKHQGFM